MGGALSAVHAQTPGSDGSRAVDFSGPCTVSASLSNGTVVDPSASGGVYTVPHKGSANYTGSIAQPTTPRAHNGSVKVSTPPLVPSINLKDPWGEPDAVTVSDSGTVTWDIPSWVPGGVEFTVSGSHNDGGLLCKGSIVVKLDGNITSGALGWVAIIGTVLTALGVLWSWMPRASRWGGPIWGAVFGFLLGLFLTVDLLFFGTFAFDSVLVLVIPLLALLIGLGLWYLALLRMAMRRST